MIFSSDSQTLKQQKKRNKFGQQEKTVAYILSVNVQPGLMRMPKWRKMICDTGMAYIGQYEVSLL